MNAHSIDPFDHLTSESDTLNKLNAFLMAVEIGSMHQRYQWRGIFSAQILSNTLSNYDAILEIYAQDYDLNEVRSKITGLVDLDHTWRERLTEVLEKRFLFSFPPTDIEDQSQEFERSQYLARCFLELVEFDGPIVNVHELVTDPSEWIVDFPGQGFVVRRENLASFFLFVGSNH